MVIQANSMDGWRSVAATNSSIRERPTDKRLMNTNSSIREREPMTKLSVNVNKVALLRNTRVHGIPSVTGAARTAIEAGAYGITVHPRPDQRHITPGDVDDLAELLKDNPDIEYNIEGNPFHQVMDIVRKIRPTQVTLVPDDPDAFTSDHGWDVKANAGRLVPIIRELKDLGCRVSLFMDADLDQIERVPDIGADRIELYTEPYAVAFAAGQEQMQPVLSAFAEAAGRAGEIGLDINAGHDLNLDNLAMFCGTVPNVLEVSIGHALIADALDMGLKQAVSAYLDELEKARTIAVRT